MTQSSKCLSMLILACTLVGLLSGQSPAGLDSKTQKLESRKSWQRPVLPSLTVHEWGTFTSIAGRDGNAVLWRPLAGTADLPSFVYQIGGRTGYRNPTRCPK